LAELEYLKKDPLLAQLVKNSVLTEKQIATYISYQTNQYKTEKSNIYQRFEQPIAKGVFHRTLQQARKNIRMSIITIILLGYIDITNISDITYDITDLLELGRMIRELKGSMASKGDISDKNKPYELLSQILRKINSDIK
jgi:hypothetical protein